jgi:hypothetical protein
MVSALETNVRGELRAWYLGSLWPKVSAAAGAGAIEQAAASAFDDYMLGLLDLADDAHAEAA